MIQPQEIEVWDVLPFLRREIVLLLLKKDFSQKKVAEILDITPACVSQYKKNKRAKHVMFNETIHNKIKVAADNIAKRESCLTKELQNLCTIIRKKGLLCELHRKQDPNVCCSCDICLK